MSDEPDYSSLPLQERLVHKVWKVRLEAYEEITKQFESSRNENDECFQEFNQKPDLFKKFITDSNVVAQESAIKTLVKFLEFGGNSTNVSRLKSADVISSLCEKTLSSSRKNTKDFAIESLLLFIEITNNIDGIIEDILPLLKHRLPKLVSGCVTALAVIVENFGCSVIPPKLIIPHLSKIFGHADRNVRAEATKLTVELYKWMGDSLVTILFPDLKPVQQKDLTKAFESVNGAVVEQKRLTRAQQEEISRRKEEEAAAEALQAGDVDVEMIDADNQSHPPSFDPYELVDPIEVLSKLPSDLNSRISSMKWKDRKEVLEEVYSILEKAAKLVPGDDYTALIKTFAKCMKDANIQVVQLAANCTEFIVKGLNKDFHRYLPIVLGPMIERTKEKKASTATALANALDAIFKVSSLTDILDETINGMKHKTPQIKIAATNYLQRCLAETEIPSKPTEINAIMEVGVKLLSDSQEPVRQASTEMIGTLMKITGERELTPFLDKIDDNRKAKVVNFFEKVQVKSKLGNASVKRNTIPTKKELTKNSAVGPSPLNKKLSLPPTSLKKPKSTLSGPSIPAKRGATSPVKRTDEAQKVSSFGRGLTGRSLVSPSNTVSAPAPKVEPTLSIIEQEELQMLRKEKQQWLAQKEKDSQIQLQFNEEKLALNQEISQLKVKNENMMKDHTNALLMVKQKETQILRLNSDLENAKLKIRDLEQTIEMMKLQQNQMQAKQSYNGYYSSSNSPFDKQKSLRSPESSGARITSGEISSRVKRLSIDGESLKENNGLMISNSNTFGRFGSPQRMADNTNTFSSQTTKETIELDINDDSWRRAAEVTSQLKARIEKMKARSRSGMNFN